MPDADTLTAQRQPHSRAEQVAHDIRRQIASGAFRQGERLASYKELGERYAVGQGTVHSAIRKLVRQGLVVTERRSGAFVAKNFNQTSERSEDTKAAVPTSLPQRRPAVAASAFFRPLQSRGPGVRMYVSELFPESVGFWDQLIRRYEATTGVGIDLQTCVDGHVQDLLQKQSFDMMETTPWVLSTSQGRKSTGLTLEQVGLKLDDLLPLAQPWFTGGDASTGLPFMATLSYLFVNLDLLEQVDMQVTGPRGGVELLSVAGELDRRLQHKGLPQRSMELGNVHDFLILEGACRWRDGKLVLSMERLQRCMAAVVASNLPQSKDSALMAERFVAGEIALLHHCSFTAVDLRQRAKFRWAMLPLIQPDGWPMPAEITLLAIDSQCKSPLDTLALARFLYSDQVQRDLAMQFGRVPVLARAALAPEVLQQHPAGDAYRHTIEHSSCSWPQGEIHRLGQCTLIKLLTHGLSQDPRGVMDRLLGAIAISFAGRLVVE